MRIGDLRLFAAPARRMMAEREAIDEMIRARAAPPLEVVRPDDLLHLSFSFVNLAIEPAARGAPPVLKRRAANRPAYLVVDCHSQHIVELALFEFDPNYKVGTPPGAPPDPDADKVTSVPLFPPRPPVFASAAGSSRLVFKVTNQTIRYSVEGILDAIMKLDLSVAPHAVPPSAGSVPPFADVFADEVDLATLFRRAPQVRIVGGRRRVASSRGPTRVAAQLAALGRRRATSAALEYRFGTESALAAQRATQLGERLRVDRAIAGIGKHVPVDELPPLPAPASPVESSIELPWRLQISPNEHGAFAHALEPVQHNGRYELWHTRLGVWSLGKNGKRRLDKDGDPLVDEETPDYRTIRAIWARDFEVLQEFGFKPAPTGDDFPAASGDEDRPRKRTSLNSRDRMMLVHETSNFHLRRRRRPWTPQAVPANRLMLTALGGWLDSRALFPNLPDGGLTIEEWKHRAALGRDHEVKVVYAGFLLPFGHRASLVKITERKLKRGLGGTAAYLFQRMFIIVREPQREFRDSRSIADRRLDLTMPFAMVRILTRVTPTLSLPQPLLAEGPGVPAGYLFQPCVLGAPFPFKIYAVDRENNAVEFSAPLVFMERDWNLGPPLGTACKAYEDAVREFDLRGQRLAYAASERPDDTTMATHSVTFDVRTAPFLEAVSQDEPRFAPLLKEAKAVVPAMSALAGAATPTRLGYPEDYAKSGFVSNAAEVFLQALDNPPMSFADQSDRSGGLITPSLKVTGLSRLTGPIGGDVTNAIGNAGFSVADFFAGISAKLLGLIPLSELFSVTGFSPDRVPKFVTQTLDVATALKFNVQRLRNAAEANAAQLGAIANQLKAHADAFLGDLTLLAADPANPPNLAGDLNDIAGDLDAFIQQIENVPGISQPQKLQLATLAQRVRDQLEDAAAVAAAVSALVQFANGIKLPEVVTARLDWSTGLDPWPSGDPVFKPKGAQAKISLAVEIQAPTRPGKQATAFASCSLSPFDLQLIGSDPFLILRFDTIEFSVGAGRKPDVNVQLNKTKGVEFAGPLLFVERLKEIIPFDGFSDPPYLDVSAEGVKSGFDLAIPDLAIGVFALTNINLGAKFQVPFIDESIETAFNFSTRENPFRLQVALFAGGGFFGITITPERVRVLEAALEFGAAVSINLGVASGGVSIMAGIYFRLETDATGENAQLTGYFRMRGEVDVLGLISACIELYLQLTYETKSKKAVGRATITVEISIAFFSTSVSISCEKKFAGSSGDPSFVAVMGMPTGAPAGAIRPWDVYVRAFAD